MIVFTLREFKRAWRDASSAYDNCTKKTNAHRLLLFYAVETGLKAVVLRRNNKVDSEDMFADTSHNLNKLLTNLYAGRDFHLPNEICLDELTLSKPPKQRKPPCDKLNQVWRYGAEARNPTDTELEAKLSKINDWIRGELK